MVNREKPQNGRDLWETTHRKVRRKQAVERKEKRDTHGELIDADERRYTATNEAEEDTGAAQNVADILKMAKH